MVIKEVLNNILCIVLGILLLCAGGTAIYFGIKSYRAESAVAQYMEQLECARRESALYAEQIARARESITGAIETNRTMAECVSGSISTLSELRKQLEKLERITREMESRLLDIDRSFSNSSNNGSNTGFDEVDN